MWRDESKKQKSWKGKRGRTHGQSKYIHNNNFHKQKSRMHTYKRGEQYESVKSTKLCVRFSAWDSRVVWSMLRYLLHSTKTKPPPLLESCRGNFLKKMREQLFTLKSDCLFSFPSLLLFTLVSERKEFQTNLPFPWCHCTVFCVCSCLCLGLVLSSSSSSTWMLLLNRILLLCTLFLENFLFGFCWVYFR